MNSSNKYVKRRDRHEVESQASCISQQKSNPSLLEARISIHINDQNLPRAEYEKVIRELCGQFGKIKTIHLPGKSKKGNLIFVEFCDSRAADKAIKYINSDRALHMVANQARPPKQFNDNSRENDGAQQDARLSFPKPSFAKPPTVQAPQTMNRAIPRQPHANDFPQRQGHQSQMNQKEPDFQSWRSPREAEPNRPFNINGNQPRQPRLPKSLETKTNHHGSNGFQSHMKVPEVPNTNVGQCNRCSRRAELKCQRCGDFYCSHVCQKSDWPQHKRFCFPMPELVPAESDPTTPVKVAPVPVTVKKLESPEVAQKKDFSPSFSLPLVTTKHTMARPQPERMIVYCDDDPKSGDIVAITWPYSTNCVYIIQNEGKMGEEYREMLNWASRQENHGPPFNCSPEKGTLVFAEFEDEWYRAIVQKVIDAEHVLVAFFDFGNAEQLHYSKLREYTGEDDPVRYTYRVYLKDCPYNVGDPFPANVANYLKTLSDQFTPLRLRYNGAWNRDTNVDLFIAETDVCVNDKILALLGTSRAELRKNREEHQKTLKESKQPPAEKFYFDDLRCERMDTENKTRVIVLCCENLETNSIWCCLETANTSIKQIDDTVNDFASKEGNLSPVIPEKNELCLVRRNEKHYERAVLVEIDDEKARVISVDYGGFYYATKDSIFKFNEALCMPLYTHMCRIEGFPTLIQGDLLGFLKEELEENTSFVVHKITFDENNEIHILHMPKLKNEAIALEYLTDETLTEGSDDLFTDCN